MGAPNGSVHCDAIVPLRSGALTRQSSIPLELEAPRQSLVETWVDTCDNSKRIDRILSTDEDLVATRVAQYPSILGLIGRVRLARRRHALVA